MTSPGVGEGAISSVWLVPGAGGLSSACSRTASAVALASATTTSKFAAFSASSATGWILSQAAVLSTNARGISPSRYFMIAPTPVFTLGSTHGGDVEGFLVVAGRGPVGPALR